MADNPITGEGTLKVLQAIRRNNKLQSLAVLAYPTIVSNGARN